ncbi:MAG: hypothetical protein QM757_02190 [Paludibaculum sp.]
MAELTQRARAAALRVMSERLNQTARRLDQAEDGPTWAAALLDGAAAYASRAILFSVINGELQYEDHRANEEQSLGDVLDGRIALTDAPAFGGVLETMDAVAICMATPSEISPRLADVLGRVRTAASPSFPSSSARARANAASPPSSTPKTTPSPSTSTSSKSSPPSPAIPSTPARPPSASKPPPRPGTAWPSPPPRPWPSPPPLPRARLVQAASRRAGTPAKAQRFARVRVAEMRLYQAQAVRQGREDGRLYLALRGEVDRGRTQFKHEFLRNPVHDRLLPHGAGPYSCQ